MSKKTLIILGIVAALIVAGIVIFILIGRQSSGGNNNISTGGLPISSTTTSTVIISSTTIPSGSAIMLGTSQGTVSVNNFYQNADSITQDQQTVVLQDKPEYSIVYNVSDSSFIISILSMPLEASRQAAEAAFLTQLGISKTDACKLRVSEGVPIGVSDQYPGENFPLSFCGDSTPL